MRSLFMMTLLAFPCSAWGGGSGGTIGGGHMQKALPLERSELLRVYKGAQRISSMLLGDPDAFILDIEERKVTFRDSGSISFDEAESAADTTEEGLE